MNPDTLHHLNGTNDEALPIDSSGTDPLLALGRPIRLVVIGGSILSDVGNTAAGPWRSLLSALTELGHDAIFIEPRGNPYLSELLQTRGSTPLREFVSAFPNVHYRTVDVPTGRELDVWLTMHLTTIDAVIVLSNAPATIVERVGLLNGLGAVRIYQAVSAGQRLDTGTFDVVYDMPVADLADAADALEDARRLATQIARNILARQQAKSQG